MSVTHAHQHRSIFVRDDIDFRSLIKRWQLSSDFWRYLETCKNQESCENESINEWYSNKHNNKIPVFPVSKLVFYVIRWWRIFLEASKENLPGFRNRWFSSFLLVLEFLWKSLRRLLIPLEEYKSIASQFFSPSLYRPLRIKMSSQKTRFSKWFWLFFEKNPFLEGTN